MLVFFLNTAIFKTFSNILTNLLIKKKLLFGLVLIYIKTNSFNKFMTYIIYLISISRLFLKFL